LAKTKFIVADAGLTEVNVTRWRNGESSFAKDKLAEETPIALIYNGVSHVVMLATPLDLEDFALGFSLSEGILQDKSELYGIEIVVQEQGIELHLDVATERFVKLKELRRNLAGRTGCGLCGAESLEQALRLPEINENDALQANIHVASSEFSETINATSIQAAFHNMQAKQALQQATGATHALSSLPFSINSGWLKNGPITLGEIV
jgi:FdhD protein